MAKKLPTKKKNEQFNRIKEVAAEKGFTQAELAKRMGKDIMTISRYYTNSIQPPLDTLFELAKVLKVDVCDLLNR